MSNEEKITELINSGADITGGAFGGIIGFLFAGPIGAAIGGGSAPLITSTIRKIGLEVKERLIGPREEVRVGAVITYATATIQDRLQAGIPLRDDGFFSSSSTERSDADEIYEATILAAQRDHQEKKLKYYGNLIVNISFDPNCDKARANHLIRVAQELSWRQVCILSLTARKANFTLRDSNYITQPTMSHSHIFLLNEIMELYNKSLIVFGTEFLMGITGIFPSRIQLEGVGVHLYNMMELSSIPDLELEGIAGLLR